LIKNFYDKETEKLFVTGKSLRFPNSIIKVSLRKLDYLNSAVSLNDLKILLEISWKL
jgi:proteic killer suppression protein